MRVAIVENVRNTYIGQVGVALAEAGAEIDWLRVWKGDPLPADPDRHDALIMFGGPQSAADDERYPYLAEVAKLMRRFDEAGKAVLGICLGSQVLARAYGAENRPGVAREFGVHGVQLTPEGRGDPLFAGMNDDFPVFQWHADTFSLPEGAIRLAASAATPNQAFRIGRAAYGIQFHFEADRAMVEAWQGSIAVPVEPQRVMKVDAAGLAIARAWVAMVAAKRAAEVS